VKGGTVAYRPEIAAALSGATVRQLSYWRSGHTPEPLLAPEFHRPRARVSYSFGDVVALRTFVYLRSRGVPLQRVRRAVERLRKMGETEHLSLYHLVAVGHDVIWQLSDQEAVDLTGRPGQQIIAEMVDILGAFVNMQTRQVLPLCEPVAGLQVDPDVRGGYPVIKGTRVPYDLVAGLVQDGLPPAEISAFYPSVGADAARGALVFAEYVDGHGPLAKVA